MIERIRLQIDAFGRKNPGLNPLFFLEAARAVLAHHHAASPAVFRVTTWRNHELEVEVHFASPDPRSERSMEREHFIEVGAIALAGLLLPHLEGKQITRVTRRRDRVDYFLGVAPGDFRWILEVGGISRGSPAGLLRRKREQLQQSPLRRGPAFCDGYVAVTKFSYPGVVVLDFVPALREDNRRGSPR
jgi:hypothetical protein